MCTFVRLMIFFRVVKFEFGAEEEVASSALCARRRSLKDGHADEDGGGTSAYVVGGEGS